MLFMGDEWGTKTPFQFFVNFENEPDLEEAVRKGRAKEFENFKSFAAGPSDTVPDPTAVETYLRSKLDWDESGRPPSRRSSRRRASSLRSDAPRWFR
jgi:1,4-alpha-glucan branching enzyme